MKTNKILTLLSVLTITFGFMACVNDDDYDTPNVNVQEPDLSSLGDKTTFNSVVSRYLDAAADGDPVGVFTLDENDLYIEGYVVSSDKAGNFFEELIIQNSIDAEDAGSDARRGLKVEINTRNLGDTYEFGRKIYIKLNGLAIEESNGVYTLGRAVGTSLEQIQDFEYRYDETATFPTFILRGSEIATISPKVTTISNLTQADENTFIQLADMQINRNELDLSFAGEPSDEFDGFRTLESCSDGSTINLQTSTFADFKSVQLPQGRGSINGIFTRDFGDDFNVFVVNSTADISFDSSERCDPIELDCGLASSEGTMNLFEDDFEGQSTGSLISGNGWTNYIQEGTEGWEAYSSGGTNSSLGISARTSSFGSDDASTIAWLITPQIDFDAQDNETLVFRTSNSFSDDSNMELLFSTDWDGTEENIVSATWGVLPAAYIVQDDDFFGAWFDSGIVDLSCAEGTMYIAFKYTGNDIGGGNNNGTYELDEISIDYTN